MPGRLFPDYRVALQQIRGLHLALLAKRNDAVSGLRRSQVAARPRPLDTGYFATVCLLRSGIRRRSRRSYAKGRCEVGPRNTPAGVLKLMVFPPAGITRIRFKGQRGLIALSASSSPGSPQSFLGQSTVISS